MTVRLVGKIAPLDAVEPGEPAQGHNLILADGGTYFVGKVGVLVHDNTPIVDWTPLAKPMAK